MSTERYNIADDDHFIRDNVKLLYITQSSFSKEWNSTPHTHKNTEIFYVVRGHGLFNVNKETFPIKEDDAIVVNPMIPHTEIGIKDETFEYIVLGISGLEFLNKSDNGSGYALSNYEDYKHEVLFYFKTLVIEATNKHIQYQAMCQNLVEILVINLTRRANLELAIQPQYAGNKECVMVERYINSHFKENITLDFLSELTYTNKYYLAHEFKKYKGISCINYMIQKRIDEAKTLLKTTNLSINEISNILGFSSQSYFTQAFRKSTNMSPSKFKNS